MDKINFKNLPSQETPISAENLNLMQSNIERAIEDNFKAGYRNGIFILGTLRIEYGVLSGMSIPAESFKSYTINFSNAFTEVPAVFLQEMGNYNIKCDVSSTTLANAIVYARSLDGYSRADRNCFWIAIGKN